MKTYENFINKLFKKEKEEKLPVTIGDYVIVKNNNDEFFDKIGQVIEATPKGFIAQYYLPQIILNNKVFGYKKYIFSYEDILHSAKTKEELELMLSADKYNL